jgi:hypothetical protein
MPQKKKLKKHINPSAESIIPMPTLTILTRRQQRKNLKKYSRLTSRS